MNLPRLFAVFLFTLTTPVSFSFAFNQPALNLSGTTLMDGGPVAPGLYLIEYLQYSDSVRAKDNKGNLIPGGARVSSISSLSQVLYQTKLPVLGGRAAFVAVLPMVGVSGTQSLGAVPITANRAGPGDIILGPGIQWNNTRLLGRPFFHRLELDITLPTGVYDPAFVANPGFNLLTIEPYYSFTWLFAEGWETSWRLFYAVHGENDRTRVRPGQVFHFNYAFSRAVYEKFRLGAAGYFLYQTSEDETAGVQSTGTEERAFALGPALAYQGKGLIFVLSYPVDLSVRNRSRTTRTTLQMIHKF